MKKIMFQIMTLEHHKQLF